MILPGTPIGSFGNFVTPRLATGGQLSSPDDILALQAAGITAVIDANDNFDDGSLIAQAGIFYLWNPTPDDGAVKSADWFRCSLTFGLPLLAQPHTRLYCHCAAGVNRGPSTLYAIMRALSWPPPDALGLIKAARPIAQVRYAPDADRAILAMGYE